MIRIIFEPGMIRNHLPYSSYRAIIPSARSFSSASRKSPADIFDRRLKHKQRDLAASKEDYETFSYLREEFGYRLSDRVFDVKRTFPIMIDMACGRGHVSKHLSEV